MIKADLHVHSRHSNHPSEWFLQKIGASECYTEPETVYKSAKSNGMDFVTITDHNKIEGSLYLKEKYPEDVITGVETTAYFPENNCKVHILIFGLTSFEYNEIEKLRRDIYQLRDFIKDRNLAYSVAHPTFSVNGKLTIPYFEKLLLLFDIFEAVNGGRSRMHNQIAFKAISSLTPDHIERLYKKHRLEPFSIDPWIKGFTGGSDDHAGLFIGKTFTTSDVSTPYEFLKALKEKKTLGQGRNNDYQSLAFTIYKIASEFSKSRGSKLSNKLVKEVNESVFEGSPISLINSLKLAIIKSVSRKNGNGNSAFLDLIDTIKKEKNIPPDEKLSHIYDKISDISDELMKALLQSVETSLGNGDIISFGRTLSSSLPGFFLAAPFFSTFFHMSQGRKLLDHLTDNYLNGRQSEPKKILWFTDTFGDLNGPSVMLNQAARIARDKGYSIKIAASLAEGEISGKLPETVMNIPFTYTFRLPYYERYLMKVPSILKALKMIYDYDPDEIYISTPGLVGLFGLAAARALSIKCTGIYHTDYTLQASDIVGNESLTEFLETSNKWFYAAVDTIAVPTQQYIDIMEKRGFSRSKMKMFHRGIDTELFRPDPAARTAVKKKYGLNGGINLLFSGRISRDKNIDFLTGIFHDLRMQETSLNLIIAGDGPYREELRTRFKNDRNIYFTGRLDQQALSSVYAASDLFVFPSTTDTFGMVVAEAQACGCPALVSDIGGPQEIVEHEESGFVLEADNRELWEQTLKALLTMIRTDPASFEEIRKNARKNILAKFNWDYVLKNMTVRSA